MKKITCLTKALLLGSCCFLSALPLTATTVFDNSVNSLRTGFWFGETECGDQIQLVGTARFLTNFSCGYLLAVTDPTPHVTAKVKFYLNDGPIPLFDTYPAPGTVVYDSDWFAVRMALPGSLVFSAGSEFPAGGLYLPSSDITWSIQFQGLVDDADAAGLMVYSPPVVGTDPPYSWANYGGEWSRDVWNGHQMNFQAKFEATDVPEPPARASLLLVVGLLVVMWARRTKWREGIDKVASGKGAATL